MSETATNSIIMECRSCNNPIEPGDHRVPANEGPRHHICDLREQLKDRYRFHISNPRHAQSVGFSLWQQTENGERPVLQNTGGLDVFQSASTGIGNPIQPSDTFFDAVSMTHHWLMCLMRGVDPDEIDEQIEMLYGEGQVTDHERWAIHHLVAHLHPPDGVIPELADVRDYVDSCTEWGTPEVMEATDG